MILTHAHVTKYKSVWDSGEFHIGDITCLVGKNEAGKTALLQSIYKINPIIAEDSEFDVTNDYPRATVSDYEEQVADEEISPATVIRATFTLESPETEPAEELLGPKVFKKKQLVLSRRYPSSGADGESTLRFVLFTDQVAGVSHLISAASVSKDLQASLNSKGANAEEIMTVLAGEEQTTEIARLTSIFKKIIKRGFDGYVYDEFIGPKKPVFLYFDEYFQMKGHENVEALLKRRDQSSLLPSDHPMLGLIGMAGIDLDALTDVKRTQELVNKLEGAGNRLSRKVLQYWSQNKHVQMRFDLRPARPEDPEGMRSGSNIWSNIYDSRHMVSTNLGTRSKGFVWFFSFLAWYSRIQKEHKNKNVILLLDEPGLFLHGRAQEDLLRYFEEELKGKHQVIYTTHSPFMVDSTKFDRVRIVQDRGIDADGTLPPEEDGTRVITEVLEASSDSLFPLQGALGYEIYQTLFLGPNCLVVEGVSDLLYLQSISGLLAKNGRESLDEKWTITPVGGSDKVPTFAALLGGQKKLKIATLIDYQSKDAQTIENLYKKRILKKQNVLTYADFTQTKEADIEDMFGDAFFLELVNAEFSKELEKKISLKDLTKKHPRILVRLEEHMQTKLNHYRPARYFAENSEALSKKLPNEALNRFEEAFKRLNALL
jgi:predicted ATP-dependent endonuclease of OLD family